MDQSINKNITLIIGGAKSGKTDFAIDMGKNIEGKKIYIATAEVLDEEMDKKIKNHKKTRGSEWDTIEEPVGIQNVILSLENKCSIVLVDCITIWLSNISNNIQDENIVFSKVTNLLEAAKQVKFKVIFVSNELGMGIVPNNPVARFFREISGKTNQMIAKIAKEVYFVTAGIPVKIK